MSPVIEVTMEEQRDDTPSTMTSGSTPAEHAPDTDSGGELSNTSATGEVPGLTPNRIAANTAFLKLTQGAAIDPTVTPIPGDDEDEGGEATSARIAQEYRRQVRIKRLAEEIQTAEREKKEEEKRRKAETEPKIEPVSQTATARISKTETIAPRISTRKTELPKAETKPKNVSVFIKKPKPPRSVRTVAIAAIVGLVLMLGGVVWAGSWAVAFIWPQKAVVSTRLNPTVDAKLAEQIRARDEELARQKALADEEKKKAEAAEARRKIEEELKVRAAEADHVRELEIARIAEEKRFKEETERNLAERRKSEDELRRKVEEASRMAREKLKRDQEELASAAAKEKEVAPAPLPLPVAAVVKPEEVAVAKKSDSKPPHFVSAQEAPSLPAQEIPPIAVKPPPLAPGLPELPSGGVRLSVKASDPYGGRLSFHWQQLKGSQTEIVEPNAADFRDGKWYSQTYFIPREPGTYEFEIVVKNEDGVESRKVFPIEVLPPTTLK